MEQSLTEKLRDLDRAHDLLGEAIALVRQAADEPHRGGLVVTMESVQQRIERAKEKQQRGKRKPR